jgi:hypothetical protein
MSVSVLATGFACRGSQSFALSSGSNLPNSQAHPHTLGMFLRREIIRNYLPGTFNIANYDRSRFQNGRNRDGPPAESTEEIQTRLKAKGIL